MSLDVYLTLPETDGDIVIESIVVREDGEMKSISYDEWQDRFPDRKPIVTCSEPDEVYWANITHNLGKMAREAGLYECMWKPTENGIETASQLIEPLRLGLDKLLSNREYFERFNPGNGWGDYDGLVRFVRNYLAACEQYPDAIVYASR